ncbi:hypothetical protein I7I53_12273 [Histoplasma capsulatum var. duboisii H88]|uniref:Uncharacterized protein n=1 Tax=Ajellomyces capsulatus (strain H88) TaxID=544711 RepID=A0A8A1LXJ1_AJEC8|nr:hypothetical protein I7I53_12273 [Histoplasma capsulatum var. duboisii H88]
MEEAGESMRIPHSNIPAGCFDGGQSRHIKESASQLKEPPPCAPPPCVSKRYVHSLRAGKLVLSDKEQTR